MKVELIILVDDRIGRKQEMVAFKDLTPEQAEKARGCKNAAELIELANSEGVELTDDQLEAISGGSWYDCFNETW